MTISTIFLYLYFISLVLSESILKDNSLPKFRCTIDEQELIIRYPNSLQEKGTQKFIQYKSNNDFKDFNIHLDLYNFYDEIKTYKLEDKKDFFEKALIKVKQTFEKILQVKQMTDNYYISDQQILDLNIKKWDKTKIGSDLGKKNIGLKSQGIDLYIFIRFGDKNEIGKTTLALAGPSYFDPITKQPIVGYIILNREVDYSKINSLRYLEGILLHEFTHILGFLKYFFDNVYHYYFTKTGDDGVIRGYLKSPMLITIAKKYFNCDNIEGIQLEEYGGEITAGSHWESRILLGEYMIGEVYPEEQVISEFTLAVLEDLKFYKAKYYTGGLMKYGKNKGCEFLNTKCVVNGKVNPKFKNEFFDKNTKYSIDKIPFDPGCSSGRLSRTYHIIYPYPEPIPKHFQYYGNEYFGGIRVMADYCPVSVNHPFEKDDREASNIYHIGSCSEIGSGKYGYFIPYKISGNKIKYFRNGDIEKYTGEEYSSNSFCVLSSLVSKNVDNYQLYSKTTRGICHQMFCSDKSLTIKINEDYIVCPREGGKIKAINYEGYLLCPDYFLICSGSVLCNDMIDCIEKKSDLKYINYDYEIKTTQDLIDSEQSLFSNNNYELSTNGKCTQHCSQCKGNNCIKCGEEYGMVQLIQNNITKRVCKHYNELKEGHYKKENDTYFYECLNNCDKCNNNEECLECKSGYDLSENKKECIEKPHKNIYIYIFVIIGLVIIIVVILFIIKAYRKSSGSAIDIDKFYNILYKQ